MRRLVLFDIDETMVKSDGVGRRALTSALETVLGRPVQSAGVVLSGKTDPQICQEILTASGVNLAELDPILSRVFETYLPILQREIERATVYHLHAGVTALIQALLSIDGVYLGLLTGNIERGARIKLEPFNLNGFFPIGAFGSDSADRLDLPSIARARATRYFKGEFAPAEIVVIGDSTNDVRCAQGYGCTSLAVNSGRTTWAELRELEPDFLFSSLTNTQEVVAAILS